MADREQIPLTGAPDEPLGGGAGDQDHGGLQDCSGSGPPDATTIPSGGDLTTDDIYHVGRHDGRPAGDQDIVQHVSAALYDAAARIRHRRAHAEDLQLRERLERDATALVDMARAYEARPEPDTSPPR
ncbi:hypothetical protein I4I73_05900 [Pseudonocardia sp. KRD-184]|uniref:Uncharacterized protein n=1 Tax=Pseudonocardia oceani TaxID=2792013 RepID=A0ABS6U901_9PSEU|nr:hypothetical protein [Pseudonocardia oceani]MBW0088650.1 hypothetical protein [Pseudonocardia oceani]MBW0095530.1 hypothetical protein [Pseudonocardia oceani]MBW0108489.1 hypothetical protein [Pseudonocardia oceani]MBW0121541.1 hypothetical protein [Pseudonocardia oceani]MBW0128722.1 hypothetical protein [Pseudonocardia oceani]